MRELKRLIHPNGVLAIKLGRHRVSDAAINGVWEFFSAHVIFTMLTALMAMAPIDFATAFSSVAACLNNLGPGLGEVALNYASLPDGAKWLLMLAMLFGRPEIFTLLVLPTPAFWRR